MNPNCYGRLFPPMGILPNTVSTSGKVFGYSAEQAGVIRSGHAITFDQEAWEECMSCAEFDGCYRLSMGILLMEVAAGR
jgi:hypothetical protein